MGLTTPNVHVQIAEFLESEYQNKSDLQLLMAFRGCGKSTMIGLYGVWRLLKDPNLRILIISADDGLAQRMVRNMRRIIERFWLAETLRPHAPDQWGTDRFTVQRTAEWRDPSVTGCGIYSNFTGMRADLIICDDVEVPSTSDTFDKRESLRELLTELSYTLAIPGMTLFAGTPHTVHTIYKTADDLSGHEKEKPFLSAARLLKIPIYDADGAPAWPERFSAVQIEKIKKRSTEAHFKSQMLLLPTSYESGDFRGDHVQVYDEEMYYSPELNQVYIGHIKMVSCSAWWDPSFASKKGDGSAIAVVFVDGAGHIFIHHLSYLSVHHDAADDNAVQQCKQVADILKSYRVPVIGIETNGIGGFLPPILRREIVRARAGTAVTEVHHRKPKIDRIMQAFETPLAARMIHVHKSVMKTRFYDELTSFRADGSVSSRHDDGLDAAASAILMEPVRIPRDSSAPFSGTLAARPTYHWRSQK